MLRELLGFAALGALAWPLAASSSEPSKTTTDPKPRLLPADILFSIGLDTAAEGAYSNEAWKKDWPTCTWAEGLDKRVTIVGGRKRSPAEVCVCFIPKTASVRKKVARSGI